MIVKVCGMREPDNIRALEQLDVDWMGFIFYPKSPRFVETLPHYMPQTTKRIGVFVDNTTADVVEKVREYGLHGVQLHGNMSADYCLRLRDELRTLDREVLLIKVFSIATAADLQQTEAYDGLCDYYLFDTRCPELGGSGRSFPWEILHDYRGETPFLLSGGISAGHVDQLAHFSHPGWAGIDLNSRFEVRPGYKDIASIDTFIHNLFKTIQR